MATRIMEPLILNTAIGAMAMRRGDTTDIEIRCTREMIMHCDEIDRPGYLHSQSIYEVHA